MRIYAKKSLGQNFLINKGVLKKIIDAADITKGDTILEVGPGTGNLTELLADCAGKVITIEKDNRLIVPLKEKFAHQKNVEILEGDVLEFMPPISGNYKIVANIPYYITSRFIKTIFEKWPIPESITLTIQKEVARRICANPPHMSILALSVQFYSKPKIISYVSKGSFSPAPNVDSAIINLLPHKDLPSIPQQKAFFVIIRAGFSSKRKKLSSNLIKQLQISQEEIETAFKNAEIEKNSRAEQLSVSQWIKILRNIQEYIPH